MAAVNEEDCRRVFVHFNFSMEVLHGVAQAIPLFNYIVTFK